MQAISRTSPLAEATNDAVRLGISATWGTTATTILSLPVMCFSLLGAAMFWRCTQNIAEHDIWWHMLNARYALQLHALPRVDMYSFPAAGSPWLDHEWLSEIVFCSGYSSFGLRGLLAVYFTILLLIFAGVYYRAARISGNCKNAILAVVFGLALAVVNIGPRLILLGWLCMVGLLLVLDYFHQSGKGLWLLPPLFALWINCHGSWIYGIAVLVITIASGLAAGRWGTVVARRWSPAELKKLLISLAASVAALFVNPFGYRLLLYPFDMLFRQQSNLKHMQEWQSIDFATGNGLLAMILILGLLAALWFSRRRWRLDEVVLAAFALWGALSHARLLFFAALILVPLLAPYVNLFPPYEKREDKTWLNAVIIMVIIGSLWFYPSQARLQQRVAATLPVDAVNFMKTNNLQAVSSIRTAGAGTWSGLRPNCSPSLTAVPTFLFTMAPSMTTEKSSCCSARSSYSTDTKSLTCSMNRTGRCRTCSITVRNGRSCMPTPSPRCIVALHPQPIENITSSPNSMIS
jgi:hypothetical protein